MRKVYYNGEFVDETEAKISVYDSALMFGDMIFEMTRSFNKEQFKLKEHIDRLYASAKYLHIPLESEMSKEEMEKAVLANDTAKKWLGAGTPKKIIVVPGKIINIVL